MEENRPNNKKTLIIFALANCLVLFSYAAYYNMWGSCAPAMMAFFNTTNSTHGFALTVQSISGLVLALGVLILGDRFNKLKMISLSVGILMASCLAVALLPFFTAGSFAYILLLLCMLFSGLCCAGIDIMVNASLPEVYSGEMRITVMPLIHAFYGVGAMIMPAVAGFIISADKPSSFSAAYFIVAAMLALAFVLYIFSSRKISALPNEKKVENVKKESGLTILKNPRAWLVMLSGFLYFSFQISFSAWMPAYAAQYTGLSASSCALCVTMLFAGALIMRFVSPIFFKRIAPVNCFLACGALAAFLLLVSCYVKSDALFMLLIALSGFLQGLCAVVLFMICGDIFPGKTASACALVVLSLNISSFIAPYAVGKVAESTGFKLPFIALYLCLALSGVACYGATKIKK